jgi:hypothetical protein
VQVLKEAAVAGRRKRERRVAQCWIFSIVWFIILAIYIKEVLLGSLPLEGFPG